MDAFFTDLERTLGPVWPLLIFVLILVLGYIVAKIVERLVRAGLRRTTLDDRLAAQMGRDPGGVSTERIAGRIVFWIIMALVFIGAFDAVNLGTVSGPFGVFVDRIFGYIPNLIGAALLALVAFVVATVLRLLTRKALEAAKVDERIRDAGRPDPDAPATTRLERDVDSPAIETRETPPPPRRTRGSISKNLSDAVFYFVLLLFLPAILDALQLTGILAPVQELVNEILSFLPNLLLAAAILIIGWFVAKVLRNIVTRLMVAAGADRLSERVGMSRATGGVRLSDLLGLIVYVLVLVPVIVAALNALQVDAVTEPASAMLAQFLNIIPRIFVAVLILGIAYVIGRLIASLVVSVLAGAGFNRIFERFGVTRAHPAEATRTVPGAQPREMGLDTRTPAGVVGIIVLVAVMLFAATEAANALGMEALALLIANFTILAGRILLGLVIFGIGLFLANLAYRAVRESNTNQAIVLAVSARISIIVLAAAMGLRQMGLADSIINLAFGLTLGAIAVATALAFGLGGREIARAQLEKMSARMEGGGVEPPRGLRPDPKEPGASPGGPGTPRL